MGRSCKKRQIGASVAYPSNVPPLKYTCMPCCRDKNVQCTRCGNESLQSRESREDMPETHQYDANWSLYTRSWLRAVIQKSTDARCNTIILWEEAARKGVGSASMAYP